MGSRYNIFLSSRDYTKMDLKKKNTVGFRGRYFTLKSGQWWNFVKRIKDHHFQQISVVRQLFLFQKIILHNGINQLVIQYHIII